MLSESMLRQLRRLAVERRPEACVGCGHECSCSIRGCRVVKMAVEELQGQQGQKWTPPAMRKRRDVVVKVEVHNEH